MKLYTYTIPYDSGFAPNPFYNYCTLATCKTGIRKSAEVGDWILARGSKVIGRDAYLVFAMQVDEIQNHNEYWSDPRFQAKKPNLFGSLKQASGDNIYEPRTMEDWRQLPSYHSNADLSRNVQHLQRDTSVDRILITQNYKYYGAEGPEIPLKFLDGGQHMAFQNCRSGRVHRDNPQLTKLVVDWVHSLPGNGYCGRPWDWKK